MAVKHRAGYSPLRQSRSRFHGTREEEAPGRPVPTSIGTKGTSGHCVHMGSHLVRFKE